MNGNLPGAYDEIEGNFCSIIHGVRSHGDEKLKSGHETRSHWGIEIRNFDISLVFILSFSIYQMGRWSGE
jgi:hypothetical protein